MTYCMRETMGDNKYRPEDNTESQNEWRFHVRLTLLI